MELSPDELKLTMNCVRHMISVCRGAELQARRDYAYAKVFDEGALAGLTERRAETAAETHRYERFLAKLQAG